MAVTRHHSSTTLQKVVNTEKAFQLADKNQLVLIYSNKVTKQDVADHVKATYPDNEAKSIRIATYKPKAARFRGKKGQKPGFKKVYITFTKPIENNQNNA